MYRLLFREVANFDARAQELERQAKPAAFLREHHMDALSLDERRYQHLLAISRDCVAEMAALDSKASAIIHDAKIKFERERASNSSVTLPAAPIELATLERQRRAMVLAAVERLGEVFTPGQIAALDHRVQQRVTATRKQVTLGSAER